MAYEYKVTKTYNYKGAPHKLREEFFRLKLNETTVVKLEHYQY